MLMGVRHASACTRVRVPDLALLLHMDAAIVHLLQHFMFTYSATRTSEPCNFVHVDLVKGEAIVDFKTSACYKYTNVSRRAIINLMMQPSMSLGFWVNKNCVQSERTSYAVVADLTAGLPA
jgi:hypothetical protein